MSYGRMADWPACWVCGSERSRRIILAPRRHTTHHDRCDCRVVYAQCVGPTPPRSLTWPPIIPACRARRRAKGLTRVTMWSRMLSRRANDPASER